MAALAYASSLVLDALLDVQSQGGPDVMGTCFTDVSADVKAKQTITIIEPGAITVNSSETAAVQTHTPTTHSIVVDKVAFANVGVLDIEDIFAGGGNGSYTTALANEIRNKIREDVARQVIDIAIAKLIGAGDAGLVANAGADAVTLADVHAAEAALLKRPGAIASTLAWALSPGASAAMKGLQNYFPGSSSVGVGRLSEINGYLAALSSHLPSSAGDKTLAVSDSVVASNFATQTIPSGHALVRGGLVTTSGLTVNTPAATAITATTATTAVHALSASDGQQADYAGSLLNASSLALLFNKSWTSVGFARSAIPKVEIVKLSVALGWTIQVSQWFGAYLKTGGVAALHAPAIAL